MIRTRKWWLCALVGYAVGALGLHLVLETYSHAPTARERLDSRGTDAATVADDLHLPPATRAPSAREPLADPVVAELERQIKLERANQDAAVADAVARWPREDQERAVRAWDSWYSVKPVFHNNGYGTWMFDALKVLFSPGESAELTAFYMKLQSYESMRNLRAQPQILLWEQPGGDAALPKEWQDLYATWDERVKDKRDLLPIAADGVACIVGPDGLAKLLAGITPPFSPDTTEDYDSKFRRWYSGNMLAKWRRFLIPSEH